MPRGTPGGTRVAISEGFAGLRPGRFPKSPKTTMDLLFNCPTCAGQLVADEAERDLPRRCAHCHVTVAVPASARSSRSGSLLRDCEIMAVQPSGINRQRTIRRVRSPLPDCGRPLIAKSARLQPPPLPRAVCAA